MNTFLEIERVYRTLKAEVVWNANTTQLVSSPNAYRATQIRGLLSYASSPPTAGEKQCYLCINNIYRMLGSHYATLSELYRYSCSKSCCFKEKNTWPWSWPWWESRLTPWPRISCVDPVLVCRTARLMLAWPDWATVGIWARSTCSLHKPRQPDVEWLWGCSTRLPASPCWWDLERWKPVLGFHSTQLLLGWHCFRRPIGRWNFYFNRYFVWQWNQPFLLIIVNLE